MVTSVDKDNAVGILYKEMWKYDVLLVLVGIWQDLSWNFCCALQNA
jgi:hypothetical protein